MLKVILKFYQLVRPLVHQNIPVDRIRQLKSIVLLKRMREVRELKWITELEKLMEQEVSELAKEYEVAAVM